VIPLFVTNLIENIQVPLYGDGRNVRDWLHVDDHCSALRAVLASGRPGESYNIGGRSERTNMEVVRAICTALVELRPRAGGAPYAQLVAHVKDRPGHDRRYAIDDTKIAGELGWKPAVGFEEGIRGTVNWYLDHQAWVDSVTSGAYREWVGQQYAALAAAA
jgi:dTDP-glucose 4,6-dehydratase